MKKHENDSILSIRSIGELEELREHLKATQRQKPIDAGETKRFDNTSQNTNTEEKQEVDINSGKNTVM